jgi:hypothetical protein
MLAPFFFKLWQASAVLLSMVVTSDNPWIIHTTMSVTVFKSSDLRTSPVFSNYPWMTTVIVEPGSLRQNVQNWLTVNGNVNQQWAVLCKVEFICLPY